MDVSLRVLTLRPIGLMREAKTLFLVTMIALGIAEVVLEGIGGVNSVQ